MKQITKELLSQIVGFTVLALLPTCSHGPSQPASPQQEQSEITLQVSPNFDAELFRVTIVFPKADTSVSRDTVMYYEQAHGDFITITVPSHISSSVTVDAFKNNAIVSTGSTDVAAGQLGLMKITQQKCAIPQTPSGLEVQCDARKNVSLVWNGVANATGYTVYRTLDTTIAAGQIGQTSAMKFVDTDVVAAVTYFYRIDAFGASGRSAPGGYTAITVGGVQVVPTVPSNVHAASTAASSISVSWDAVASASSYNLYRLKQGETQPRKIASSATVSFIDTGLAQQSVWGYCVSAENSAGESALSAVAWATVALSKPSVPQSVTATALSDKSLRIAWSPVQFAQQYTIQWAISSSGPVASATADSAVYVISGLTASTMYYVQVIAENNAGQSAASSTVQATTLPVPVQSPAAPTLTAAGSSDTSIGVSWQQVQGAAGYYIERATAAGGPFSAICTTATLFLIDGKLTPSTDYYYRGKAVNSAGESPYSPVVSAATGLRLAPPTGLTQASATSTSISLTWQSVSGAQSYIVYRSASASGAFAAVATVASAQCTDTGLTPNTAYYYKVSSVSASAQSAQSAALSATTSASALPAPTGVKATAASSTSVTVTWNAVSGATGYILYRGASSAALTQIATVAAVTTYTNSGLTAATTYYYAACATNAGGTSAKSTAVSVVTQSAAKKAVISASACRSCGRCVPVCAPKAISKSGNVYVVDPAKCNGDGKCVSACPFGAITLK